MLGAQEKNGPGNLLRSANPAQRNSVENRFTRFRVRQRRPRHVGLYPAGSDAIDINTISNQLGRKSFDHADKRALRRSIVTVERLADRKSTRLNSSHL